MFSKIRIAPSRETISDMRTNPEYLLLLLWIAMAFAFAGWMTLLNNFSIEKIAFTGKDIGFLQSLREIPGLLAFTALAWLIIISEQKFAIFSLGLLGAGVFLTGFFPTTQGIYITTVIMSVGFHYFEAVNTSLTLQFFSKKETPLILGRQLSAKSMGSIAVFIFIWAIIFFLEADYAVIYALIGSFTILASFVAWWGWPVFKTGLAQRKHIVLRRRYGLFYLLTFFGGARRQIFVVFAAFMMVEKFNFAASTIALIFLFNHLVNTKLAPSFGRFIMRFGERNALCIEYIGLFCVFTGYAFVESPVIAIMLYIFDHIFFSLAIAIKSYFQKIADPADIASSAAVSFSINHIAAVALPALLGFLWLLAPHYVFLTGSAIALLSLMASLFVPDDPAPGNEIESPFGKAPRLQAG